MRIGAAQQRSSECGCTAGAWLNQSTANLKCTRATSTKTCKQHVRQTSQNRILKTQYFLLMLRGSCLQLMPASCFGFFGCLEGLYRAFCLSYVFRRLMVDETERGASVRKKRHQLRRSSEVPVHARSPCTKFFFSPSTLQNPLGHRHLHQT